MPIEVLGKFEGSSITIGAKKISSDNIVSDLTTKLHSHDFSELTIVVKGNGVHRMVNSKYPIVAGNVFVVTEGQSHCMVEMNDMLFYEICFNPKKLSMPISLMRKIPGFNTLFMVQPKSKLKNKGYLLLNPIILSEVIQIVESMTVEYEKKQEGYEAYLQSKLLELIVILSREYENLGKNEKNIIYKLGNLISSIESDYRNNWSLLEMCKMADMSKSKLYIVFKKVTNHTPIEYLIHVRIRHSLNLLETTDLSIKEIASNIGFTDSNYFSRQFKKVLGRSPNSYRKGF